MSIINRRDNMALDGLFRAISMNAQDASMTARKTTTSPTDQLKAITAFRNSIMRDMAVIDEVLGLSLDSIPS